LDARPGERILDACAAPGGKAAHILERAGIGLVPEGRRCFSGLTVHENLIAAARPGDWDFAAYVPVSALLEENLGPIVEVLEGLLPEGPAYFPPGTKTDQPEEFLVGELIREKFLARLREELPHSLAVVVEEMEEQDNGVLRIEARLVVERQSQKGIVIGKGGAVIKEAATEARLEIERLLGTRVFLEARVKVEKDWQQRPGLIERLGM
jgi:GTP-binding protein Era